MLLSLKIGGRRAHFVWEFGKVPDVVIEIVQQKGEEKGTKRREYARIGVPITLSTTRVKTLGETC